MKATITQINLKSPFHFFRLSLYALNIVRQLQKSKYVEFKKTGIWTTHYTMTLWNSEQDMKEFARSGAHLESMKVSKKIASKIKAVTIDAESLPDWKTAKQLLKSVEGISYN